jgi:hypothetical protein
MKNIDEFKVKIEEFIEKKFKLLEEKKKYEEDL